jgi:glutathione S-transferase
MNPNGRVPVLQTDDGGYLAESNAILVYLARDSRFLPGDPWLQAQALQWMFFEQYSHEPFIAVVRHWIADLGLEEEYEDKIAEKRPGGYAALAVMDGRLDGNDYLVGAAYSVADISLYAYTHVAEEGGFDLEPYPNVRAWIERVQAQPGHIPITQG